MSDRAWFDVVAAVFRRPRLVRGAVALIASAFMMTLAAGPALAATPTVTTGPVTNVTAVDATFSGTVNPNGETIQSEGFWYGTAASGCSPSGTSGCMAIAPNTGSASSPTATLTDHFSPGTTYVVFLAVEDATTGWSYGQPVQFTTPGPATPATPSISLGSPVVSTDGCDHGANAVARLSATVSIDDPNSQDQWGAGFYYSATKLPYGPNGPQGMTQLTSGGGQLNGVGSNQKVTGTAPRGGRLAPGTYYYFLNLYATGSTWPNGRSFFSPEGTFVVSTSCGSPSSDVFDSLGVSGPSGTIAVILRAGGYPATAIAPRPGTLTITWRYGKSTVIALGTKKFGKAGGAALKLRLTSAGRTLLKKSSNIKLTAIGTFKPTKGKTVTKHKTITLHKSVLP